MEHVVLQVKEPEAAELADGPRYFTRELVAAQVERPQEGEVAYGLRDCTLDPR